MAIVVRRPSILTVPAAATGPATPTLIYHTVSSSNPVGVGISEDNFRLPAFDPGAGNCIVLGITYPHGNTPTITDNNGNSWPAAAVTVDGGVGNFISSIFVLPNANAGLTTITISFGAIIIPFQYTLSVFNNIATSSPANGTSSVGVTQASSGALNTGTITPTTNPGGNLIWNYYCLGANAGANPAGWTPGSGFTLLDGDIAWTNNAGVPHASQWQVTAATSINPGVTGIDNTNFYNGVAVALKVASAGTAKPAGIHVDKIIHHTDTAPPASWPLLMPATGNLRVMTWTTPGVTSITDNESGSWTILDSVGGAALAYSVNKAANAGLKVTFHSAGTMAQTSVRFFDISGAAVAPFDVSATLTATTLNGAATISNAPSITPTNTNGLVIACLQLGAGPGLDITSPANAVFDLCTSVTKFTGSIGGAGNLVLTAGVPTQGKIEVGMNIFGAGITAPTPTIASLGTGSGGSGTYNLSASPGAIGSEPMTCGETDADLMENADGSAHFYNLSGATLNFNWNITNQSTNSGTAVAAAFKAA